MSEASFLAWLNSLVPKLIARNIHKKIKWPNGFICPYCGKDHHYKIACHYLYEYTQCKKQTSITAGTLFHGSKITLIQ